MKPQITHAEAEVFIRQGTLDDLPAYQTLADSLRNFGGFKAPDIVKKTGGSKTDRYCKACFTRHPLAEFLLKSGEVHKNYCRKEAERIALKKQKFRGVI